MKTLAQHVEGSDRTMSLRRSAGDVSMRLQDSPRQQLQRARLLTVFGAAPGVCQRAAVTKNALNVAGENHDESDLRRETEREMAQQLAGGAYWEEGDFTAAPGSSEPADPWRLRLLFCFKECSQQLTRLAVFKSKDLIDLTRKGQNEFVLDAMKVIREVLSFYTFGDLQGHAKNVFGDQYDVTAKSFIRQSRRLRKSIRGLSRADPQTSTYEVDITEMIALIGKLTTCFADMQRVLESNDPGFMHRDLSKERSVKMHEASERNNAVRGLWKIGEHHAHDMSGFSPRSYNLMSKNEFDAEVVKFAETWQPPPPTKLKLKLKFKVPEEKGEAQAEVKEKAEERSKRQRLGEKQEAQADAPQDTSLPISAATLPKQDENEN